jgi:hypothetical protein
VRGIRCGLAQGTEESWIKVGYTRNLVIKDRCADGDGTVSLAKRTTVLTRSLSRRAGSTNWLLRLRWPGMRPTVPTERRHPCWRSSTWSFSLPQRGYCSRGASTATTCSVVQVDATDVSG